MLSPDQISQIKCEIEQIALLHLNAKDIDTALRNYTDDVVAVSNTKVSSSREELASELAGFYTVLERVNHASWEKINIHVINEKAAAFTAKFMYSFTSNCGEITDLSGNWTALFIKEDDNWKIRMRHESFEEI
jgi:ketosteroid isomerase-like protein